MTRLISGRGHPSLAFELWPEADRTAWSVAIQTKGFMRRGGKGAEWRPAPRKTAIGVYGRWLAWLAAEEPGAYGELPAERLNPIRVERYAQLLLTGCASVTAASYIGVMCMAVIAMFPEKEWDWLRTMQKGLRRNAAPVREKQFANAGDLFQLGIGLMEDAEALMSNDNRAASPSRQQLAAARQYRDGLMIALLAARPLRIANFVAMVIGIHVVQTPTQTTIRFAKHETKTHRALHQAWPDDLLPALARYLKDVRPRLIAGPAPGGNEQYVGAGPGARLWVGQGGTALSPAGLNKMLGRRTELAFGYAMTAHRFRDSVATTITNQDPTKLRYAADILGHARVATTERSYVARDDGQALASHHDRIRSMRLAFKRRAVSRPGDEFA